MEPRSQPIYIAFTRSEAQIIHQALNEVCNGLSLPEFETRMGANREEVQNLLVRLTEVLDAP
jgi:hypothetical protein